MTYSAQDNSIHDGEPIEFFKFVAPNATYRYNDSDADLTLAGEIYTSIAIERTTIEVGTSIASSATVDVLVPFDSDVAINHGYLITPDYLDVTIYRAHRGSDLSTDFRTIWQARAQAFSINGLMLSIKTQNVLATSISGQLLNVYYQTLCNHRLYDDRCKVNKAAHTTTSEVAILGSSSITVLNDGVDDHALKAGEARNVRTGERRLIMDNLVNVITIAYPFTDILVGDTVALSKGCQHDVLACLAFNNTDNYGGFRFIPRNNPLGSE